MQYRFFISLLVIFGLFSVQVVVAETGMSTAAKQAIVVDYDTGAVLLEKNADEQMPTSSMSKVMTMYLVFDALKEGQISLDDEFLVSEKAWRKGGSKMFVEVGKTAKVEDLIRGVIVQSGNDATIVLAEGLAGTEEAFAAALNQKAKALGMNNSQFMNASGWPDPQHYSTARDLSTLGVKLIKNFPEYYPYYSEMDFTYSDIKQGNRNPLLYRNIGADGIKTGHTEDGGYGLIGSGTHEGRRVVLVINGTESVRQRAEESAKLLDWGLKRFENDVVFHKGDVVEKLQVAYGREPEVSVVVDNDILVTLPKLASAGYEVTLKAKQPVIAPMRAGDELGIILVHVPGQEEVSYPVYAGHDVKKQGIFGYTMSKLGYLLESLTQMPGPAVTQ